MPASAGSARLGVLSIAGMVVVGLVAGVAARWIYPAAVATTASTLALVAIIGSLAGGLGGGLLWRAPGGRLHPAGWILAILCAFFVLWLYIYVRPD